MAIIINMVPFVNDLAHSAPQIKVNCKECKHTAKQTGHWWISPAPLLLLQKACVIHTEDHVKASHLVWFQTVSHQRDLVACLSATVTKLAKSVCVSLKNFTKEYLCTKSSPPGTLSKSSSHLLCGYGDHPWGTVRHKEQARYQVWTTKAHYNQSLLVQILLPLTFRSPFTAAGPVAGAADSSVFTTKVCPVVSEVMMKKIRAI